MFSRSSNRTANIGDFLVGAVIFTAATSAACRASAPPPPAQEAAPAFKVHGNLLQVMRGVLFPNSNVIFAAQSTDPATMKPADDPSLSPNPLTSTYGKWDAVENSSLALSEAANLLTIPGRQCSNGKPVPIGNADWQKFVQGLRDAGMTSYKAAQAKNQDQILEAADAVSTACSNCHDVYREKTPEQGGLGARCTP